MDNTVNFDTLIALSGSSESKKIHVVKNQNIFNKQLKKNDLSYAIFSELSFNDCLLDEIIFSGDSFYSGEFKNVRFYNCDFCNCDFHDFKFVECVFLECLFGKAEFYDCIFEDCAFEKNDMIWSYHASSNFSKVKIIRNDLKGVTIIKSNLSLMLFIDNISDKMTISNTLLYTTDKILNDSKDITIAISGK